MISRIDGFIGEKNGGKYLNTVSTNRNNEVLKRYSEVWDGINIVLKK